MITPDQIRQKARNIYGELLTAELRGQAATFFPRVIPCNKRAVGDLSTAADTVRKLRQESKDVCGFGYAIEWKEVNSRTYGKNAFPARVVFETERDFLRLLEKETEFEGFRRAAAELRARYPMLMEWAVGHRQILIENAGDIDGLLEVVDCLRARPRPGVFTRELPLSVDSKFIGRHARILRDWLDLALPPEAINAAEAHFERRFGLAHAEQEILVRFLDPDIQLASNSPWETVAVPIGHWNRSIPTATRVFIVENKTNLLTLPMRADAIAIGGLGNAVTELARLTWLASRDLWYWGDIDVEGLAILARLRSVLPNVRSVFMDIETLERWRATVSIPRQSRGL